MLKTGGNVHSPAIKDEEEMLETRKKQKTRSER